MCASCDAWVEPRRDPKWKPGKGIPRVKRPPISAADRRLIRQGVNPGTV